MIFQLHFYVLDHSLYMLICHEFSPENAVQQYRFLIYNNPIYMH